MAHRPSSLSSQASSASHKGFRDSIKGGIRKAKEKLDLGSIRNATSSVVVVLAPVAELASDISDNVGIPGLKFGIKCISEVLRRAEVRDLVCPFYDRPLTHVLKLMSETKEEVENLKGRMTLLRRLLERLTDPSRRDSLLGSMRERFTRFAE